MKRIKKKFAEIYLNSKFKKIGDFDLKNNNLVCLIDIEKIIKNYSDESNKNIYLESRIDKKILEMLGIENITYLFENCIIPKTLIMSVPFANVKFKNCSFVNGIDIIEANNLTFEGKLYLENHNERDKVSLLGSPKKLEFINSRIEIFPFLDAHLFFDCPFTAIINSKFYLGHLSEFNLKGENLYIINSKLSLSTISLDLQYLKCDKSKIEATKLAKVNVEECKEIDCFNSDKLIIDNDEVASIEKILEAEESRTRLVKVLRELSLEFQKKDINENEKVEEARQKIKKCSK